tara:strand:- start:3188 stop:3865 length:678 start_codon:yes stop_codon:yes gene_type:complete
MVLALLFFFIFFLLPKAWLSFSMSRNDKELSLMPFNAQEFGNILLTENKLSEVKIEETHLGDHYDLRDKTVRILEGRLEKKSLTSLAVVCHEISHAIQHKEEYGPLVRRTELVDKTQWISKAGGLILYSGLPIVLATGSVGLIKVFAGLALITVLLNVFIHLITLDVELDASFKKAMPILEKKIPSSYHAQCRNVLRAAAFTYVIGALTSFLSLRYLWVLVSRVR